jgi:hypothetical protein
VPVLSIVPEVAKQRPPPVVQINFKASKAFADLIAREAEKQVLRGGCLLV